MAEWSCFFNSFEGDRRYTAAEFAEYFAGFIGNGVMFGANYLKVNKNAGMEVLVMPGKGFINGYYYINKSLPKVLVLEPSHITKPRIDRIVLRLNLAHAGRYISAMVKTGEPADSPVPPGLQRDNAVWELGLADVRVNPGVFEILQSNITDLRLSAAYCGIVTGFLEQPDLTQIFNQYNARYEELNSHWLAWKNSYEGWITQVKAEAFANVSTDFDDWTRRTGYRLTTTFQPNGNITEEIRNRGNNTLLAGRVTEFLSDGRIKETITFTDPALVTSKTTTFLDNTITEDYN